MCKIEGVITCERTGSPVRYVVVGDGLNLRRKVTCRSICSSGGGTLDGLYGQGYLVVQCDHPECGTDQVILATLTPGVVDFGY